ncbi:MAG: PAS domain-containing sensor histidine kinase [Nitrospirae bacterium]|nr:PAS domain-containing sensor histidine kinase [Nitrospirota bacterium]
MLTFKNIPLLQKMLILTIIVGVITWAILDSVQNRTIKKTFDAQLSEGIQTDYSSSDLEIEFFTLLPNIQSAALSKSILRIERRSRIIAALSLILSFSLIMVWITKRIRKLTNRVIDFSVEKLNTERQDLKGGDELEVLEGHFENMTDIIVMSHEYLKQQAESLRKQRDMAQNYLDITGTAILALNANGEVTLINKKGCKILGYAENEIVGKNWFDNFIPKKLKNEEMTVFVKLITGVLKPVESLENTVITKTGEERVLAWHNTMLKDDSGNIVGTLSSGEDITERKQLEKSIIEIEEWERQRIGHDLHDGLGQLLTGIAFKSQSIESGLEEKSIEEARDAAEISLLVEQAKAQVRRLSRGLLPVELDSEGLMAALELLASYTEKIFGIPCVFMCDDPVSVHNKTAVTQLYRIAQEAVTNAVKHGKPGRIDISLKNENGKTIMTIQDDGTGISGISDQATGMGLKIMRYRASLINASIDIQRGSDGGTQVICDIIL